MNNSVGRDKRLTDKGEKGVFLGRIARKLRRNHQFDGWSRGKKDSFQENRGSYFSECFRHTWKRRGKEGEEVGDGK